MDQVPLEDAQGNYTALSYCAGDPKKTAPILINGIAFNAFANLGLALQEAVVYWEEKGLDWEKYYLWADQICINQSNTDERSHQVGMMRDIYACAARVLICLDVCGSESEGEGSVGMHWARDQISKVVPERFHVISPPKEKHDPQGFQQGLISFLELILRPWWRRAWICQEFIFAAEADFASGGVSIPWQFFSSILLFYYQDFSIFRDPYPGLWQERNICSKSTTGYLRTKYGGQLRTRILATSNLFDQKIGWTGPKDIKVWLDHGTSCETSDPRDRVFAFLGLASPGYNIEPDYSPSKSWNVLMIEITSRILKFEKSFEFLQFLQRRNEESNRGYANHGSLPSWIPDWTVRHRRSKLSWGKCFKAEYFSQFPPSVMPGGILKLEGFKLDTFPEIQMSGLEIYTRKGLHLAPLKYERTRSCDSLWYFPAAGCSTLLTLRPDGDYWQLLDVAEAHILQERYNSILRRLRGFAAWNDRFWVARLNYLLWDWNHAALIKMKGVKREIVYIR
jgi:hypothetical protein